MQLYKCYDDDVDVYPAVASIRPATQKDCLHFRQAAYQLDASPGRAVFLLPLCLVESQLQVGQALPQPLPQILHAIRKTGAHGPSETRMPRFRL